MTQTTLDGSSFAAVAVALLQEHEPPEGYYLAFSGGKDSIVCYDLLQKSGVKFDAHYNMTTIDPPELTAFIRRHYPDVHWHKPMYKGKRTNFYRLIETKGLPNRWVRWCCSVLKEGGGAKRTVVVGVRAAESVKRSKYAIYEPKHNDSNTYLLRPILRWETSDVWDYIRANELPYCELYDRGWDRIGCIMCPLACIRKRHMDMLRYPAVYRAICRAVGVYIKNHPETSLLKWGNTPEEIVYMWIAETPATDETGQCQFTG